MVVGETHHFRKHPHTLNTQRVPTNVREVQILLLARSSQH